MCTIHLRQQKEQKNRFDYFPRYKSFYVFAELSNVLSLRPARAIIKVYNSPLLYVGCKL